MTLSRLVSFVQTAGMLIGCGLILVAVAIGHSLVAFAGLMAMSPVLVPFMANEFLGIPMPKFFRPPAAAIDDLPGAK